MSAQAQAVDVFDLVIFGGTGDLALRKLVPALFQRYADGQVPAGSRIVAIARDALDESAYRDRVRAALARAGDKLDGDVLAHFLELVHYRALDATADPGWDELAAFLAGAEKRVRVFYLATGADVFMPICARLGALGLTGGEVRVVIEKPIGSDLKSAAAINDAVGRSFAERQIFRIDHYLGK
ncbi:MAG TPA: glucose-6-phosphate dehydrogenase, partial [Rudaea sp.]|nr:glucose-6-phosphate dehydrogenase [Rudaea sp.]